MEMQDWALVVGLVLGGFAFLSVCFVWLRHQKFGMGGACLSVMGVVFVGLSIWSTVQIEISPDSIKANFEKLEQQVEQTQQNVAKVGERVEKSQVKIENIDQQVAAVQKASSVIVEEFDKLETNVKAHDDRLTVLVDSLKESQIIEPNIAPRRPDLPSIDRRRLEEIRPIIRFSDSNGGVGRQLGGP